MGEITTVDPRTLVGQRVETEQGEGWIVGWSEQRQQLQVADRPTALDGADYDVEWLSRRSMPPAEDLDAVREWLEDRGTVWVLEEPVFTETQACPCSCDACYIGKTGIHLLGADRGMCHCEQKGCGCADRE